MEEKLIFACEDKIQVMSLAVSLGSYENLIEALGQDHNNNLWRGVYKEFRPMVINLIKKNSGSYEEALDLYQDVMASLYNNVKDGKVREDSNIKNYIYSLAFNQWRTRLRKKGIEMPIEDFSIGIIDGGEEENPDYSNVLKDVFDKIHEKCRDLISLRYSSQKKSMDEIAQLFGFKDARSATSQLNKCMEKAREAAKQVIKHLD
jgi:RNA polymerase sigma factor (sigma-70 family)